MASSGRRSRKAKESNLKIYIRDQREKIGKKIESDKVYRITYTISGTDHDGYCSGAEDEDIIPVNYIAHMPILSDIPEELKEVDKIYTSDNFYVKVPFRIFELYQFSSWCSSGSGYCGTKTNFTIVHVKVVAKK